MSARHKNFYALISLLQLFYSLYACAQSDELAGGALTATLPREVVLELPAPSVSSEIDFNRHLDGHAFFHRSFRSVSASGKPILGPHFNNDSCGSCHIRVGRGPVHISPSATGSTMVVKVGPRTQAPTRNTPKLPGIGEQLQDRSLQGRARFQIKLRWKYTRGTYADGQLYNLRRPHLSFSLPGYRMREISTSLRMTPQLIGMGLLEAIPSERILSLADPADRDGDGISGKVNLVFDRESDSLQVGRFGFKATHPTLKQQTAAALFNDMGITTELFQSRRRPPELGAPELLTLVFYQQLSGVPGRRNSQAPDVAKGRQLFEAIGCAKCHIPSHHTSPTALPTYLASQTIYPYTDLLLHDMGPDLADNRAEFRAYGREWRTTPLWGLGMYEAISPRNTGFLHDGRARTPAEAILWHGGEASDSRTAFVSLPALQRHQLIDFLRSL